MNAAQRVKEIPPAFLADNDAVLRKIRLALSTGQMHEIVKREMIKPKQFTDKGREMFINTDSEEISDSDDEQNEEKKNQDGNDSEGSW